MRERGKEGGTGGRRARRRRRRGGGGGYRTKNKNPTRQCGEKGRATNGVSHVYQTCQADVKTCHLKAKNAHLKKHSRETSAIYHVCQTYQGDGKAETEWSETSMSNLPGRREHAACRPKMPGKTWQGDEWRKPCISNMPGRRLSIYLCIYLSVYTSEYLFISPSINQSIINLPTYLFIYLSI